MSREAVNSTFFLYNTICSITIYDTDGDWDVILNGAKELAFKIRGMLDFYDQDSELGLLNRRHIPGAAYEVSEELCLFIAELLKFSKASEGCFDPTIGPVVRLWNITAHEPKAPVKQEIAQARRQTGAEYVRCDTKRRKVVFLKEGMVLDAGGAGKGYAAGRVAEYLVKSGVRSASINFGGNLCLIGGKKAPDGTEGLWKVGIQAPWTKIPESVGTLTLRDCGIATSGGYDRYFSENGRIYHHLIDPRTGYPADNSLDGVTIVSKSALYTDLLSTACFVGGEEMADRICGRSGVEAGYVLIRKDGTVKVSDQLKKYYKPDKVQKGMNEYGE